MEKKEKVHVHGYLIQSSYDFDSLRNDNGWYKLYKIIISQDPKKIRHVPLHRISTRLTEEQYAELCQLAGDDFTNWKNEHIVEKDKRIKQTKQATEEFLRALRE
jgi:hypothetical protein